MLKTIGGESGKPLDGEIQKIYMRSICDSIFAEQLQTKMTWTGKTNTKSVKKIALQDCKKITELIYGLAAAADRTIDIKIAKNLIVYSVLKYAYRNAKTDVVDTSDSTSLSTTTASINDTSVKKSTVVTDPLQNSAVLSSANRIDPQPNPPNSMNLCHQNTSGPSGSYSDPSYAHYHYPNILQQQQQPVPQYQHHQFPYQHQPYQHQPTYHQL